jgi:hypothetical protein
MPTRIMFALKPSWILSKSMPENAAHVGTGPLQVLEEFDPLPKFE